MKAHADLRSVAFRREREASWLELERLVTVVEQRGLKALAPDETLRLPALYRTALSSLSVARSISLDQALRHYLEALAQRAYVVVYGSRTSIWQQLGGYLRAGWPQAVRRHRVALAVATLAMVAAAVFAFVLTTREPGTYFAFVGEMAQGRSPLTTTEQLRAGLYDQAGFSDGLTTFAASLFSHNTQIAFLAFALGALFGVPTIMLLMSNGAVLGAFAALYHSRGLSADLWGWLLPHGITELSAIVMAGGAGLVIAGALIRPGTQTRVARLREIGPDAGRIALGAAIMLFIAGGIEGMFRQMVIDVTARYLVATVTAVGWLAYFTLVGRRRGV